MRTSYKKINLNTPSSVSFNSPYTPLKNIYTASVCMIVSGSVNGTAKLQASNDPETNDTQTNSTSGTPPSVGPANWCDITGSSTSVTGNNPSPVMWNLDGIGYNFIRYVWTDASGGVTTGTITVQINIKGM